MCPPMLTHGIWFTIICYSVTVVVEVVAKCSIIQQQYRTPSKKSRKAGPGWISCFSELVRSCADLLKDGDVSEICLFFVLPCNCFYVSLPLVGRPVLWSRCVLVRSCDSTAVVEIALRRNRAYHCRGRSYVNIKVQRLSVYISAYCCIESGGSSSDGCCGCSSV